MEHAREEYEVSERHACRLLGQWRRTQRYAAIPRIDGDALTEAIIALASEYGRYGYRRISVELRKAGWIDEYTRECLAIRVARRLGSYEVIETLADVMVWRGIPEHIRSDNGLTAEC